MPVADSFLLAAGNSWLATFSKGTTGPGISWLMWCGAALVVVLAIVAIAVTWVISHLLTSQRRQSINSPVRLLTDLCAAHNLSGGQRRLLERLAQFHQIDNPALLFVEPSYLDPARLGTTWQWQAQAIAELRAILFARE